MLSCWPILPSCLLQIHHRGKVDTRFWEEHKQVPEHSREVCRECLTLVHHRTPVSPLNCMLSAKLIGYGYHGFLWLWNVFLRINKVLSLLADQYRCLAYFYLRPLHIVWSWALKCSVKSYMTGPLHQMLWMNFYSCGFHTLDKIQ